MSTEGEDVCWIGEFLVGYSQTIPSMFYEEQDNGRINKQMPMNPNNRVFALDHLRAFVIALVVFHHSILAYCSFGHLDYDSYLASTAPIIDAQRWRGFDVLALLNDSFFMPLMFWLSGLFLWPSLTRKGSWSYLSHRCIRLGIPFALTVTLCTPLAYYPSWLEVGGTSGLASFFFKMITAGPWPSGPPWFLAVLFFFDVVTIAAATVLGWSKTAKGPQPTFNANTYFIWTVALSLLAYLPLLEIFGPTRWLSAGPFSVQASRIGLYFIYFAAGVAFGSRKGGDDSSSLARTLTRSWIPWTLIALFAAIALVVTALPEWHFKQTHALAFIVFCGAMCFCLTAIFLRFCNRPRSIPDNLAVNSYGIYLLHFPAVTWFQHSLLHAPLNAPAKAALTFICAFSISWGSTILLRRLTPVRLVISLLSSRRRCV